jgi:transcriptional regulator with PAS, ATPase and Fis domain
MEINETHKLNPHYLTFDDILYKSKSMEKTIKLSKKVADSSSPITITGESGTGKEMFAKAIHFTSKRKNNPFIPINCSAIPDSLMESILFGYEDGAFTGAKKGGMIGQFELAHNGTVFLDEIGDMNLNMQVKLLRVLETKMIQRIGSSNFINVNYRLITATNKELHEQVRGGSFRKDLFYRIGTIPIRIPSLRERKEDINLLAYYFLNKYKNINNYIEDISDSVLELLTEYIWEGNVRELEHVIEYSCNTCESKIIEVKDLPSRFWSAHRAETKHGTDLNNLQENNYITNISELEKNEIIKALAYFGNTQNDLVAAANALGISLSTLYRKINKYDLSSIK